MKREKLIYFGGAATYFLSHRLPTAHAALDQNYQVHVLAIDDGFAEQVAELGIVFHPRVLQSDSWPVLSSLFGFIQLVILSFWLDVRIIHCIGLKNSPVGLMASLLLWRTRFIFSINGLGYLFSTSNPGNFYQFIRWFVLKMYSAVSWLRRVEIVFQNDDDREVFLRFGNFRRAKCHIIRGSGVDMTKYAPSPLPPSNPVIFGVACRMLKIKGVEELIIVFNKLISDGVPVKLLLAGDVDNGNPASLTKEFLIAAGHEGACEWRGFVDDMTGFWSECHVAALPSHGGEGVPMALLMAASMGRALLASDTNGNRDIVLPGRNGFLCLPNDVESLKLAVLQCLEADLVALGKESRQIVFEREMDDVAVRRAFAKLYN